MGLTTLLAAAALAAAPIPVADLPVQIGHGAQTLHGSLMRPDHLAGSAAVLLIAGSGPEDRNGDDLKDGARSQQLRLLARALAERGIVSLRYDKRGVGESAAAGDPTSIGQLAGDAEAWARFLRRQPGVGCVVIVGHSEGAEIGTLAAQKTQLCGLVLLSAPSMDIGDLIESQGQAVRRSPEVSARIHEIIVALRSGRPVGEVPAGYESVFGPKAARYTRSEIKVEPVAELAKVRVPVLVVQGDNDLQNPVEATRRLAAAARVQPVIVAGMTHPLKLAPKDIKANIDTYTNPDLPLAPELVEAVSGFVLARR